MEILNKLYLELAHAVSPETKTFREIALEKQRDAIAVSMMMIAHGAAEPQQVACEALLKLDQLKNNYAASPTPPTESNPT